MEASPPSQELKMELATGCVGYCSANLKALCTEATIHAFCEKYPQVCKSNEKFLIDIDLVKVERSENGKTSKSQKPESLPQLSKTPTAATGPTKRELKAKKRWRKGLEAPPWDPARTLKYEEEILKKQCFSDYHYPVMDKDDDDERPIIKNLMDMATLLQCVDVSAEADCRSKKCNVNVNATWQSPNAAEVEAKKKLFVKRTK
ncbi:hypothetical protein LguiA_022037 [Lonicera macranthoides]